MKLFFISAVFLSSDAGKEWDTSTDAFSAAELYTLLRAEIVWW